MDIGADRISFIIVAAVFAGGALGSGLVYNEMSNELNQLETQLENKNDVNTQIIYRNGSEGSLAPVYEKVDQSTVIIRTRGNESSQGSGFVYNKKGHIVTNEHVVDGANDLRVEFFDGTTKSAKVIGEDPYTDLAVIKAERDNLQPLKLANSTEVRTGERAIAIGSPFGLGSSLTAGYVSGKDRSLPVQEIGLEGFRIRDIIQTDASINPGNSGGPLLNSQGEVIGVNTAIETQTGTFSGIGFAVPSNTVRRVAPEIINQGEAEHPWIGVRGRNLNKEAAEAMNLTTSEGFLVMEVSPDGPAQKAGLQGGNQTIELRNGEYTIGGDVIIGINNEKMRDLEDILNYLAQEAEVGEEIQVTVIRDGKRKTMPLTLEERPER